MSRVLYRDGVYKDFGEQPSMFQIQLGYGLLPLLDEKKSKHPFKYPFKPLPLLEELSCKRNMIDAEYGLPLPKINIRDNMCLGPNEYAIFFYGVEIGKGEVDPEGYHCLDTGYVIPDSIDKNKYQKYKDPAFGMDGFIAKTKEDRDLFADAGYVCIRSAQIIMGHFEELVRKNRTKILTQCMVNELTEKVRQSNPDVFTDVFFIRQFHVSDMKILLNSLLEEYVSIRDMNTIIETIADYLGEEKNPLRLAEKVRVRLAYSFIKKYADSNSVLHVFKLSEGLNDLLSDNVYYPESKIEPPCISLEPEIRKIVYAKISESIKNVSDKGYQPVILCSCSLRLPMATFLHYSMPGVAVISDMEIMAFKWNFEIKLEGEVTLE